jgi:SepF-like predicted cell division protein (DUF552 family)
VLMVIMRNTQKRTPDLEMLVGKFNLKEIDDLMNERIQYASEDNLYSQFHSANTRGWHSDSSWLIRNTAISERGDIGNLKKLAGEELTYIVVLDLTTILLKDDFPPKK